MDQGTPNYSDETEDQALVKAGNLMRLDGTESVLLIDDEEDLIEEIGDYLEVLGYRVFLACSGAAGLKLLDEATPDIIVCDVSMPGMNGHQVLQAIRSRTDHFANVPFVFLTAYGALDDHLTGLGVGADDFIAKPAELSIVAARIRARLDQVSRFRKDIEALKRASEERPVGSASRERRLASNITHLSKTLEQISGQLAEIVSLSDSDAKLSELARQAMSGIEKACAHAKGATILARPLPPAMPLSPQRCNAAELLMEAARAASPGIETGDISFHVEEGPEVIVDASQIRQITTDCTSWVATFYPGATLTAEAKQAERNIMLSFRIAHSKHASEDIAVAWNTLVRRSIGLEEGGHAETLGAELLSPANVAMFESIGALIWNGGMTFADVRQNEAVLNVSCIY